VLFRSDKVKWNEKSLKGNKLGDIDTTPTLGIGLTASRSDKFDGKAGSEDAGPCSNGGEKRTVYTDVTWKVEVTIGLGLGPVSYPVYTGTFGQKTVKKRISFLADCCCDSSS